MSMYEAAIEIREAINDVGTDIEQAVRALSSTSSPQYHARQLIKKMANGDYQYETSVSVDAGDRALLISELRKLNQEVDDVARQEIARRQAVDAFREEASAA